MPTNNQIVLMLKEKIDSIMTRGTTDAETLRNVLKEELQFYVLNFIYHHSEYGEWIMYGGSALRICHDLDRMSVDLDFETTHKIDDPFLKDLKNEIDGYFKTTHNLSDELLTIKITNDRGLRLCFYIGDLVGLDIHSKQVIVKIDLNFFTAPKTTTERIPINHNQLSFVIKTYNMSSLMASKIAAILLRGQRGGVDGILYEEKGRDIYDLLWYMNKKIVPDLDYLKAKNIDITNLRELFDKLTVKMNSVNDTNLKNDLTPLFTNQTYIENWLQNWRTTYLRLFDDYEINTVTVLEKISISNDFHTDNYSFIFWYKTDKKSLFTVTINISDYWLRFSEGDLQIASTEKLENLVEFYTKNTGRNNITHDKLLKYAALFHQKIERHVKKNNYTVFGNSIDTKLIRMTADKLDQKEQVVLNKSALVTCELDDLLK